MSRGANAVVEQIAAARYEIAAAGQVDWAGKAADRYAAIVQQGLAGLVGLRHAAEATHWAALRHEAAVEAARAGA